MTSATAGWVRLRETRSLLATTVILSLFALGCPEEGAGGADAGSTASADAAGDAGSLDSTTDGPPINPAGELVLAGPWPQHAPTRFGAFDEVQVASAYAVAQGGAPGPFQAAPCKDSCSQTCGVAIPHNPGSLTNVVVAPGDQIFVLSGLIQDRRLYALSAGGGSLTGLAEIEIPAGSAEGSLHDILYVEEQDGRGHLVIFSDHNLVSLDPDSYALRWKINLVEPGLTVRLSASGRFIVQTTSGTLIEAELPDDGDETVSRMVNLETEGRSEVISFELDDAGRIYALMNDYLRAYDCNDAWQEPLVRLRVFGPPVIRSGIHPAFREQSDAPLLMEHNELADAYFLLGWLQVERAKEVTDPPTYRASVIGRTPPHDYCHAPRIYMLRDPTHFSDDPRDGRACPTKYEQACTSGVGLCPCLGGCGGMLQICPGPIVFEDGDPTTSSGWKLNMIDTFTYEVDSPGSMVLDHRHTILRSRIEGPLASDGHGLVYGTGALLNIASRTPADDVVWSGYHIFGPAFAGRPAEDPASTSSRFAHATSSMFFHLEQGTADRTDAISIGAMADMQTSSRTVLRQRLYEDAYGYVTSDMVPLSGGRFLSITSDFGASGDIIELRVLAPTTQWWHGRDIQPGADSGIPEICTDSPLCPWDLGLNVSWQEVFADAPPEVNCGDDPCTDLAAERLDDHIDNDGMAYAFWDRTELTCTQTQQDVRVVMVDNEPENRYYLQCLSWTERFRKVRRDLGSVVLRDRVGLCAEFGQAKPWRVFRSTYREPEVHILDAEGDPVDDIAEGDTFYVSVETDGAVEITIEGEGGVFEATGAGGTAAATGNQPVGITATGAGIITLQIRVVLADGRSINIEVAVIVEGPRSCTETDGQFFACDVAPPYALPSGPGALEAPNAPAVAGDGVLLHDMSLMTSATDLEMSSIGMDMAFERTYRSAALPYGGGPLGGWHFSWDQRLTRFFVGDEAQVGMPMCLGEDVAGSADFRIALADGSGRLDFFGPATSTAVTSFTAGAALDEMFLVFDHGTGALEPAIFTARVAELTAAPGLLSTLKIYTIIPDAGERVKDLHPYYSVGGSVGSFDSRFYELTEADGTRKIFNCSGQMVRVIDRNFREIELLYKGGNDPLSGRRLLSRIIDSSGRPYQIRWAYAGSGDLYLPRVASITDPTGREVLFAYEEHPTLGAALTTVTHAFYHHDTAVNVLEAWTYAYDDDGYLTSVHGPDGLRELLTTYEAGAVTQQITGGGEGDCPHTTDAAECARWSYSSTGTTAVVTDPRGGAWTYALEPISAGGALAIASESVDASVFDGNTRSPGTSLETSMTIWSYDSRGLPTEIIHPEGRIETFVYSAAGNLESWTETPASGLGGQTRTHTWEFDPACQSLLREVDDGGRETLYTLHSWDLTSPGLRCQTASVAHPTVPGRADQGGDAAWTETFEIIGAGPLRGLPSATELTRSGVVVKRTLLSYNDEADEYNPEPSPAGQLRRNRLGHLKTREVSGATPARCDGTVPAALLSSYQTDRAGNILEERLHGTAGDAVTTYAYDKKNRKLLAVRDPDGLAATTRYEYGAAGLLIRTIQEVSDHFTNPSVPAQPGHTQVTRVAYDKARRPFATLVHSPDGPAGAAAEIHGLDPMGNAVWTITPGPGATSFDESAITTFLSNAAPTPGAAEATFPVAGYPGNFDPDAGAHFLRVEQTFDSMGRLQYRRTTDGRAPWSSGSRPSVADPFVHTWTESTFYDLAGNVVLLDRGRSDVAGAFTHKTYDGNRHMVSDRVLDPDCPDGVALHETRHDNLRPDGKPAVVAVLGPIGGAVDVAAAVPAKCETPALVAQTDLEYDAWGRVAVSRQQIFALADGGDLLDTHAPDLRVLATTRDFEGRETSSTAQYGGHTFSDYTFFGDVCAVSDVEPASLAMSWRSGRAFDDLGRTVSTKEEHFASGETAPAISVATTYERDSLGRITRETGGAGLVTHKLYDSLGRQRIAFEAGAPNAFATTIQYGHFVISGYDALGRPTSSTHLVTTEIGNEARTRTITYGGAFPREEVQSSTAGEQIATRKTYDSAGRVVRSEPHGDGSVETSIYNEAGHLIREHKANGAEVSYGVDGRGIATTVSAVNGDLTDLITLRHNGLGQPFFVRTESAGLGGVGFDLGIPSRDSTVTRVYNSVGDVLQESSSTVDAEYSDNDGDVLRQSAGVTTTLRATYHPSGKPTGICFDGAARDTPDLSYVFDFHDRVVEIHGPGPRDVFADLFRVRYNYLGHLLGSREMVGSFISTFDYNEQGERYRVRHYSGTDATPTAQIFESTKYWHGRHSAATTAFVVKDGQEQGAIAAELEALRQPGTLSHLREWPAPAVEPATFPHFPDNLWPSTYALFEKNGFGDSIRTVTHTWPAFSGRPTTSFKYDLYAEGGWTLERESVITWLAAEDPGQNFDAGSITEWREGILFQGLSRINGSIQQIAREPAIAPQILSILPTMPPDIVESSRSYDVTHDATGALVAYGLDQTDPVGAGHQPNRYVFDGLGRMVEAIDGQTEVYTGSISQVGHVPRAEEHVITYDGLHRRHREIFSRNYQTGGAGSRLPSERDRHFGYLGAQLLEETNDLFGSPLRDRFLNGPAGDLPFVDLHHGEFVLLEDINGSFVVAYNASDGGYEALHSASGAPVDLKGQPYIISEQELADKMSGGLLALLGDWMTIPFAVDRDGGDFFRRLSPRTELSPFEGVTWTEGRGYTFGLAPHPHYAHEMLRMSEIDQTNALITEGIILVASMVVPYLGIWAAFAFDLATGDVETAVLGLIPGLGPAGKALHSISKAGSLGKAYRSVKGLGGIPGSVGDFYGSMRSLTPSYASVVKAKKSAAAVKGIPGDISGAWGDVVQARTDLMRYGGWLQHSSGGSWRKAYGLGRKQLGGFFRGKNKFMPAVEEVSKRVRPRSLVETSRVPVHLLRSTPLPAKKLKLSPAIKQRIWADPPTPFDDLLSQDNLDSYQDFLEKYRPVHGTSDATQSASRFYEAQFGHGFQP